MEEIQLWFGVFLWYQGNASKNTKTVTGKPEESHSCFQELI